MGPPLGKLARWLRILGLDTEYYRNWTTTDCIKHCLDKNRIFLTKSKNANANANKLGIHSIYIEKSGILEQLGELVKKGIDLPELDISKARCSLCNAKIKLYTENEGNLSIPQGSRNYYSVFYQCVNCNQPYWEGSHWIRIRETMERINLV